MLQLTLLCELTRVTGIEMNILFQHNFITSSLDCMMSRSDVEHLLRHTHVPRDVIT